MTATPMLAAWIESYAAQAAQEDELTDLVDRVNGEILATVPELGADPVLLSELHASTRAHWVSFLARLPQPEQQIELPVPAVTLALSLARRGYDFGVLLKVYRVGRRTVWESITQMVDELPESSELSRAAVLVYIWDRASNWIDDAIEGLLQVFDDERQRLLDEAIARRGDLIRAILDGKVDDPDAASIELGHSLRHQQTAVAVWADDDAPTPEADDSLQRMVGAISECLGAPKALLMAVSSRCVWAWVATRSQPDLSGIASVVAAQAQRVRVAVGAPSPGLDGFRQSHREAVQAQRVTMTSGQPRRLTFYSDVELIALTTDQHDAMRILVERELGALAGPEASLEPVRAALLHYLRLGGNVEGTAALLHIHKNTVRYRLARAEELIGRPLAERRASIELALRFVEEYGVG